MVLHGITKNNSLSQRLYHRSYVCHSVHARFPRVNRVTYVRANFIWPSLPRGRPVPEAGVAHVLVDDVAVVVWVAARVLVGPLEGED